LPNPQAGDPHDPRFDLDRQETLALVALGEPVAEQRRDLAAHIDSCPACQDELTALRRTVVLARHAGENRDDHASVPAPRVWQQIATELQLSERGSADDHRRDSRPTDRNDGRDSSGPESRRGIAVRAPSWRHRMLLAAAAVLIAAAGVGGGYWAGHNSRPGRAAVSATARLTQITGGPGGAGGVATVHETAAGPQLSVRTHGLPLRAGYYEVWLFNPTANKMVAVGTLPQTGAATLPVPPGLDVDAYHVVDVSAQLYNGNPTHRQSVLRGALTR
jgi:hypothetical protein